MTGQGIFKDINNPCRSCVVCVGGRKAFGLSPYYHFWWVGSADCLHGPSLVWCTWHRCPLTIRWYWIPCRLTRCCPRSGPMLQVPQWYLHSCIIPLLHQGISQWPVFWQLSLPGFAEQASDTWQSHVALTTALILTKSSLAAANPVVLYCAKKALTSESNTYSNEYNTMVPEVQWLRKPQLGSLQIFTNVTRPSHDS